MTLDYDDLMPKISREFDIKKSERETETDWIIRVLYSLCGKMALNSLLDTVEDDKVTINHFKNRIIEIINAYTDLFDSDLLNFRFEDWPEFIDNHYLSNGCFYHRAYSLTSCIRKTSKSEYVTFLRGASFGEKVFLSGLGQYKLADKNDANSTIPEMFKLSNPVPTDNLDFLISKALWVPVSKGSRYEFLNYNRDVNKHYWKDTNSKNDEISLMRTVNVPHAYYLYENIDGKMFCSLLPEWMVKDYGYISISLGIMLKKGLQPLIEVDDWGPVLSLKLDYLLPPSEQKFMELYSWPAFNNINVNDFSNKTNRIIDKRVFSAMKPWIEKVGFSIKGE